MQRTFFRSLTGKTLLRLAAAGSVLLIAAAVVNSCLLYRTSKSEVMLRLAATAAEGSLTDHCSRRGVARGASTLLCCASGFTSVSARRLSALTLF